MIATDGVDAAGAAGVGAGPGPGPCVGSSAVLVLDAAGVDDTVRYRSPRIVASAWITVFPPRIIRCEPWIWDRREILLPVSWTARQLCICTCRGIPVLVAYRLDVLALGYFGRHSLGVLT